MLVRWLAGQPEYTEQSSGATSVPLHLSLIVDALLSIGEWKRAEAVIEQSEHHTGGRLRAASWAAAKAVPIADPEDQAILDGDLAVGP